MGRRRSSPTSDSPPTISAEATTLPVAEYEAPSPWRDPALLWIVAGNALTLLGALVQQWPAKPVMWVYWGQSVILGAANVIRMLSLKDFTTEGLRSGNRPVPATRAGQVSTATFFAFHYGFFHLAYAFFLNSNALGGPMPTGVLIPVLANVAAFGYAHAGPLVRAGGNDLAQRRPNLGTLMFYPYLRILPMHLAIIFGSSAPQQALPLFIALKTGADVGLHFVEARLFRGAPRPRSDSA